MDKITKWHVELLEYKVKILEDKVKSIQNILDLNLDIIGMLK